MPASQKSSHPKSGHIIRCFQGRHFCQRKDNALYMGKEVEEVLINKSAMTIINIYCSPFLITNSFHFSQSCCIVCCHHMALSSDMTFTSSPATHNEQTPGNHHHLQHNPNSSDKINSLLATPTLVSPLLLHPSSQIVSELVWPLIIKP